MLVIPISLSNFFTFVLIDRGKASVRRRNLNQHILYTHVTFSPLTPFLAEVSAYVHRRSKPVFCRLCWCSKAVEMTSVNFNYFNDATNLIPNTLFVGNLDP